jgi:hypothetical protein
MEIYQVPTKTDENTRNMSIVVSLIVKNKRKRNQNSVQ